MHDYCFEIGDTTRIYSLNRLQEKNIPDPKVCTDMTVVPELMSLKQVQIGDKPMKDPGEKLNLVQNLLKKYKSIFGPVDTHNQQSYHHFMLFSNKNAQPVKQKSSSITTRSPCFCVDRDQKAYGYALVGESSWSLGKSSCCCLKKRWKFSCVCWLCESEQFDSERCIPKPEYWWKNFLHGLLEIHGLQKLIWQSGYNQVELAEDSSDILAITTHAGLYKPTRMSFGPCNAPAHFQRSLEGLFAKLPGTRVYFDDCPTVGKKPLKSSWRRTLRHSSIAVRKLTSCWMHRNALLDHQFCLWLDVRLVVQLKLGIQPSRVNALPSLKGLTKLVCSFCLQHQLQW